MFRPKSKPDEPTQTTDAPPTKTMSNTALQSSDPATAKASPSALTSGGVYGTPPPPSPVASESTLGCMDNEGDNVETGGKPPKPSSDEEDDEETSSDGDSEMEIYSRIPPLPIMSLGWDQPNALQNLRELKRKHEKNWVKRYAEVIEITLMMTGSLLATALFGYIMYVMLAEDDFN